MPTSTQTKPVVYIVDDDDDVLLTLHNIIDSIHLPVESFSSAKEFLSAYHPDIQGCLLTDVFMPEMSGLKLQQHLSHCGSSLAVIVITGQGDTSMAVHAMKSGACDFITKPFNNQLLLERVQFALALGKKQHLRMQTKTAFLKQLDQLTSREKQVMDLVAEGERNKSIAQKLDISLKTVELHKHNMMKKLQLTSVADLVRNLVSIEINN